MFFLPRNDRMQRSQAGQGIHKLRNKEIREAGTAVTAGPQHLIACMPSAEFASSGASAAASVLPITRTHTSLAPDPLPHRRRRRRQVGLISLPPFLPLFDLRSLFFHLFSIVAAKFLRNNMASPRTRRFLHELKPKDDNNVSISFSPSFP